MEGVTLKKLRITSKMYPAQVFVIQDGSAADATATIKVDDGFRLGYVPAGITTNSSRRIMFALESLECGRDGKTLTFSIQDQLNRNTLGIGPGDKVEFWCENGDALADVTGSFPAWHSAEQSGQCLHFVGFVEAVPRSERDGGFRRFTVRARDPLSIANKITIVQSRGENVLIPYAIFNVDTMQDTDYFFAIKKYDASGSTRADKYKYGNPKDPAASRMSLAEILDYLQGAHQSDLYDRGLIAGSSDDIFDSADLAQFDTVYPPKTVFENAKFGDAVRQLLRTNAPEFDVFVDPRTLKWRIVPTAKDIVAGDVHEIVSVTSARLKFTVADLTGLATSGTGSTVRLQSVTNPMASEVRDIVAINSGTKEITLDSVTSFEFDVDDLIIPMHASSERPPSVLLDLEASGGDNELVTSLDGVYTAVEIVSRHQKVSEINISQSASAEVAVHLQNAWNQQYQTDFSPTLHRWRRTDAGKDGAGIIIESIGSVFNGSAEYSEVFFSEESSAYDDDHKIISDDDAEWVGTAFHLFTIDDGATNVEGQNITAIISRFTRSGWMDAAQTIRRYRILLDRNIRTTAPTITGRDQGGDGDRFEMTSSELYKPNNANRRGMVGQILAMESTTIDDEARLIDNDACPSMVQFQGQNGAPQVLTGVPAERSTDALRSFPGQVAYHGLNPGINGAPRIWFIHPADPAPTFEELCAKLPPSPESQLREVKISAKKYNNEVLRARFPTSGYAGLAYWWHKHLEPLVIISDSFEDVSQTDQFTAVCAALWARVSPPNYQGRLTLNGVKRWLRMADLGFRVTFGPGDTGILSGVVTEQRRFWGLVQSISYSFTDGRTSISFTTRDVGEDFLQSFYERQFVSETAEMKEMKERLKRTEKAQQCLAVRPTPAPAQVVQGCNVAHTTQSISRKVTVINPKQTAIGTGETALGAPPTNGGASATGSPPASNGGSMDFHPTWVVERDYFRKPFAVKVPSGAIYGGTETGKRFIPSNTTPANPVTLPQHTADALQELALAILGIDLVTPKAAVIVEIDAGSTDTILYLRNAIADDGRYVGGTIEFKDTTTPRPPYVVASHTSRSITLTGAMSETIPGAGGSATLWPPKMPTLNPVDFPQGGKAFKDSSGSWFVATAGQIVPATLSGSTLSKTTGTTAPSLGIVTKKDYETRLIDWELWLDFSAGRNHDANTGSIANTNPSYAAAGTYNAAMAYYGWADTQKRGNLIQFMVPKDLDTTQAITIELVAELSGSISSGNTIVISGDFRAVADNEAAETGGVTNAVKVAKNIESSGYASLDLLRMDLGTMFAANTLDPGDFVHGVVYRDTGSDAADTYTGTVRAIGVVVRGKRRLGGSTNDGNKIGGADGEDTARSYLLGTF